jgi:hypothetical protein
VLAQQNAPSTPSSPLGPGLRSRLLRSLSVVRESVAGVRGLLRRYPARTGTGTGTLRVPIRPGQSGRRAPAQTRPSRCRQPLLAKRTSSARPAQRHDLVTTKVRIEPPSPMTRGSAACRVRRTRSTTRPPSKWSTGTSTSYPRGTGTPHALGLRPAPVLRYDAWQGSRCGGSGSDRAIRQPATCEPTDRF